MKKIGILMLTLCMGFSLTACGQKTAGEPTAKEQTSAASAEEPIVMIFSHDEVNDSVIHKSCLDFKDYVEKESGGRIQVDIYPNSELASADKAVDMISMGTVQATNCNSDMLAVYNDKLTFMCLPFLFDSYEQAYEVACDPEGVLHKLYQEEANKAGFYVLGMPYLGARALTNNVREIKTAEDMKGLKLRAKSSDMSVATFDALGCNVTPLAFNEIYTALQQKVVDGQDNPAINDVNLKFIDVQKYYSDLGHDMNISITVCSYDWLMDLPEDLREIVVTAGELYGGKQITELTLEQEEVALKAIEDAGLTVTHIEDKSTFIEATKSVYDKFRAIYGDEFMDQVLAAVGKQ